MKTRDYFWVYVPVNRQTQEQALTGACSWCCLDSEKLKRVKTSDGDTLKICPDCLNLGRRASIGGFAIPRIAIPLIKEKRNTN